MSTITTVCNHNIDNARGFDVIDHAGKVLQHFATYEEAEAYRKAHKGTLTRFWVKVEAQK